MVVEFTPDEEARLSQIASHAGKNAEMLVKEAALRLLSEDDEFREAVQLGIDQADNGEFLEEDEMDRRVQVMLQGR